jgi:hypothetical protein
MLMSQKQTEEATTTKSLKDDKDRGYHFKGTDGLY